MRPSRSDLFTRCNGSIVADDVRRYWPRLHVICVKRGHAHTHRQKPKHECWLFLNSEHPCTVCTCVYIYIYMYIYIYVYVYVYVYNYNYMLYIHNYIILMLHDVTHITYLQPTIIQHKETIHQNFTLTENGKRKYYRKKQPDPWHCIVVILIKHTHGHEATWSLCIAHLTCFNLLFAINIVKKPPHSITYFHFTLGADMCK